MIPRLPDSVIAVDAERFRELVRAEVARLSSLPPLSESVQRITVGRISGAYMAMSFLDECVVRNDAGAG